MRLRSLRLTVLICLSLPTHSSGMRLPPTSDRRSALLVATAALWAPPPCPSTAAAAPPFELTLPPSFVQLRNLGGTSSGAGYLLVAGDFSTTIKSGGATTLSVQLLEPRALPPLLPASTTDASLSFAAACAQYRDRDTTNPKPSQVLAETVTTATEASRIRFEMLTSLTGTDPTEADPSLVRHTLVQAVIAPEGVLVLWAGAQQADWENGAAETLRAAADTFGARRP